MSLGSISLTYFGPQGRPMVVFILFSSVEAKGRLEIPEENRTNHRP